MEWNPSNSIQDSPFFLANTATNPKKFKKDIIAYIPTSKIPKFGRQVPCGISCWETSGKNATYPLLVDIKKGCRLAEYMRTTGALKPLLRHLASSS
jgi:hypothetical protein